METKSGEPDIDAAAPVSVDLGPKTRLAKSLSRSAAHFLD